MNKYNKDELERLIFKENLSYKEIGKNMEYLEILLERMQKS